jgi:DNA modification methylase
MASWITNGMTRSDIGFGNWIYLSLFSKENESIYRQAQDIIRCTIDISTTNESSHRGRKPVEMMVALTDLYCKKEGVIIDPFLGSGTTLFVAEKTNRSCIGGELSPDYCKKIINRWELTTSNKAERI